MAKLFSFFKKKGKNKTEPPPLLDEPWRKTSYNFSKEGCSKLKASLDKTDDKQHILLLGPIGAGKSSFVNSINSMSLGKIVNPAYAGKGIHSVSTEHELHKDVGKFQHLVLHDTMGLESGDGQGLVTEDVNAMIRGEMPEFYKFDPQGAYSSTTSSSAQNEKARCIIFFFNATSLDIADSKILQKMFVLENAVKKHRITRLLCLTHIDSLCEEVHKDLTKTFNSRKIYEAVKRASEIFGIPLSNIHPIKNYENEIETDFAVDMLLLFPLRQAHDFAIQNAQK